MKTYVSLTSIFQNQDILEKTLLSILNQTHKPDKIFIFLSENSYLLDKGFKNKIITDKNLNSVLNNPLVELRWVLNEGSYRKLLPLLKEKWTEDCFIITIDDDTIYDKNLLKNLIIDYNNHHCVVNYRGFTPKSKNLKDFDYNKRDKTINKHILNFSTGKGGILYKPSFFHKTEDIIFNDKLYKNICPKQDDVWFYILRIKNNIDCYIDNKCYLVKDLGRKGLFEHYNKHNNFNTITVRKVYNKIY